MDWQSDLANRFPEHLEEVFEAMADAVWVCNAEPRLLWINSACEKLNGIRREDVCGKTVHELLLSGNYDKDVTSRVLQEKKPVVINQHVKSGRSLLVTGVPIFDEQGAVRFVVGNERDLSELNQLRQELEKEQQRSDRIEQELLTLNMRDKSLENIVAVSDVMEKSLYLALKVAAYDTTVLIAGPSGSGKSMVARLIHEASPRRNNQFLHLNCGAIPHNLVEAELFGYEQGAFTGASKGGKAGLIEAANGGTLFLDEIDAFPMDMQVKLLTFLDSQGFIRVGGTKIHQVDVRLISATNKDLRKMVDEGLFREDLYFRLNIVPLEIPPLQRRMADLPALIGLTLKKLGQKHNKDFSITPEFVEILSKYSFPGNVRELENILERACVLSTSEMLSIADLPADIRDRRGSDVALGTGTLKAALEQVEAELLRQALGKHDTQKSLAVALGVSQPTVARLLRKHDLKAGRDFG
ncbi:sigma-54 interaction domain-containing protein [Sneathiella aquimaris]|uniref:sigma-54 interaction domain-containing protein n=1 Tax=Sneathiella aquimaris TaxID=2599305 RepID=UPI00146C5AB0|nr:sigma 54-interacting transcriptional regulator [Sneathiella aquimaris]